MRLQLVRLRLPLLLLHLARVFLQTSGFARAAVRSQSCVP